MSANRWLALPLQDCTALSVFTVSLSPGGIPMTWGNSAIDRQEVVVTLLSLLPPSLAIFNIVFDTPTTDAVDPLCALSRHNWGRVGATLASHPNLKTICVVFKISSPEGFGGLKTCQLSDPTVSSLRRLMPSLRGK